MDPTPEELDKIRAEADEIDVNQYRRRFRLLKAIGLGALMAGLVWLGLEMFEGKKNPCERVRDHFCALDAKGLDCQMYTGIWDESVNDESPKMRQNIRAQCQAKIDRLKADGVSVK